MELSNALVKLKRLEELPVITKDILLNNTITNIYIYVCVSKINILGKKKGVTKSPAHCCVFPHKSSHSTVKFSCENDITIVQLKK